VVVWEFCFSFRRSPASISFGSPSKVSRTEAGAFPWSGPHRFIFTRLFRSFVEQAWTRAHRSRPFHSTRIQNDRESSAMHSLGVVSLRFIFLPQFWSFLNRVFPIAYNFDRRSPFRGPQCPAEFRRKLPSESEKRNAISAQFADHSRGRSVRCRPFGSPVKHPGDLRVRLNGDLEGQSVSFTGNHSDLDERGLSPEPWSSPSGWIPEGQQTIFTAMRGVRGLRTEDLMPGREKGRKSDSMLCRRLSFSGTLC
jgi:hypothetical protein